MPLFGRRVSFDCYDPDLIPPHKAEQSIHAQIIPNTPFEPRHRYSAPPSPVIRNANEYSNQTLQTGGASSNRRMYHQMSDSELLQLDSQFSKRKLSDIDGFRTFEETRLSHAPLSSSNTTSLTTFKAAKLNPYSLKEYPTKPIISRNSISMVFSHPKFHEKTPDDKSAKIYLILLSSDASSICALDYYKNSLIKNGDTIVIGLSVSSRAIGDKSSSKLNSFIDDFTSHILNYLSQDVPIKIIFEIFKSINYLNDLLSLYYPSTVIIGTDRKYSRSTSFSNGQRKFIPLVYAGLEEIDRSLNSTVTFNEPFAHDGKKVSETPKNEKYTTTNLDPITKETTGIQIQIQEPTNTSKFDQNVIDLFSNLNLAPDPKPRDKSLDRRSSMHSSTNSFSSGNHRLSGSAVDSDDDDDQNNIENSSSPPSLNRNSYSGSVLQCPSGNSNILKKANSVGSGERWKSCGSGSGSGSSIGLLSKEERDRLALFEQHQKAITNVNTKKNNDDIPRSMKPKKKITSNTNNDNTTSSGSNFTTGFFKKLLGRK